MKLGERLRATFDVVRIKLGDVERDCRASYGQKCWTAVFVAEFEHACWSHSCMNDYGQSDTTFAHH